MNEKNGQPRLVYVVGLVLVLVVFAFYMNSSLQNELSSNGGNFIQEEKNVIVVSGQSQVEVAPDIAYVNVSVSVENKDAKEAQEEASNIMNTIYDELKEFGIEKEDLETTNYNINQIRDYRYESKMKEEGKIPTPIGYRVSNTMNIKVSNIEEVGNVIDKITKKENVSIGNLRFDLSDDNKGSKEAIEKATQNAKDQAETVAETLGVKIKGVKKVNIGNVDSGQPYPYNNYRMYGKSVDESVAEPTPISSGNLNVSANVQVEFIIE